MSNPPIDVQVGPFDPGWPIGWYSGMTLDVSPLPQGVPPDLGAHWQSFSLGDYSQQWQVVRGGGVQPDVFRHYPTETWGSITLNRPWIPNGSASIAGWMEYARQNGPATVTITVGVQNTAPAVPGAAPAQQTLQFVFHNAVPTKWQAPKFGAPIASSQSDLAFESLTIDYAGYDLTMMDATGAVATPSFSYSRTAPPQATLRILLGGGIAAAPLSALTSWTNPATLLGATSTAPAQAVASLAGLGGVEPTVTFWVAPSQFQVSKSSSWVVTNSPAAQGSGPVAWQGTNPMSLSFNFTLTCLPAEIGQVSNSGAASSIQPTIDTLLALLEADPTLVFAPSLNSPPLVIYEFGNFISPVSYVAGLNITIERFDDSGNPTRASGSMTLQQYPMPDVAQNPTSGGLATEQQGELYPGDVLPHLAYRFYRSPARWRDLAEANGVDDPLRIGSGSVLSVPNIATLPARTETGLVRTQPTKRSAPPALGSS